MTTPRPLENYAYNNNAQRWTNVNTGRFVANAEVTDEMLRLSDASQNTLQNLTGALYDGQINLQQWQASIAQELKDGHLAQAIFGAGGRRNMTSVEYGRVGGTLADEYRYLANFANDISSGRVSRSQALARINQYGRSTRQSYWREYREASEYVNWVLNPAEHCASCVALASGSPYPANQLPTVPGAGATECRGNCRCTLERVTR